MYLIEVLGQNRNFSNHKSHMDEQYLCNEYKLIGVNSTLINQLVKIYRALKWIHQHGATNRSYKDELFTLKGMREAQSALTCSYNGVDVVLGLLCAYKCSLIAKPTQSTSVSCTDQQVCPPNGLLSRERTATPHLRMHDVSGEESCARRPPTHKASPVDCACPPE